MESVNKFGELSPELKFGMSLLKLSPNPVGILQDYIYLDCNDAMLKLYGIDSKKCIRGQRVGGRFSPDKQPNEEDSATAMKRHVEECLESGKASFTWVSKRSDGQLIHSYLDLCRLDYFADPLILLFYRDLSAHVAAQQELQDSENRFQALAVHAPVGIYISDEQGNCLFVNPKLRELVGVTDDSMLGHGWAKWLHPDDMERLEKNWEPFSEGKKPFSLNLRFVPDGKEEVWVSSNAIPIESVSGGPARYIGTTTDITEMVRFEQQLEKSRDEAERANQAKTVFLSHMSHELRTPLNAILGFGQLLQLDNSNLKQEQREAVDHILAGGEHLLSLIEDILDLSRIEAGKLELAMRPVETDELLRRTMAMVSPMADKKGIQLRLPDEPLPRVMADPLRLQQVLVNLLNNAIKYNREGGFVSIRGEDTPDGGVRIHVVDNGKGIHPQLRSELFKPFERIRLGNEGVEGSGIGLGLSQLLVERMGGRIDFHSEYGKGSDFWIDLIKAGSEKSDGSRQ